jgi:hypothetical protein
MSHATAVDDVTMVFPPETRWSLTSTRPARLVVRLIAAALGVAIAGGTATACLVLSFGATDVSPVARILAMVLPLALLAMIILRLAAAYGRVSASPSNRWLAWTAAASAVVTAAIQIWPEADWSRNGVAGLARGIVATIFYGTLFGLVPAAASLTILIPALLLLRASGTGMNLATAQVLLTAVAIAVTAAYAVFLAGVDTGSGIVTGMATALAGTGALLTARWCLVDRHA